MDKESFFQILCRSTPEELNEFISQKGTKKKVNGITFIEENEEDSQNDEN